MVVFKQKGDFSKTDKFLKGVGNLNLQHILDMYGREGVRALASATPVDSGATSSAWTYETKTSKGGFSITWFNGNVNGGVPIAIILQYGHGTGTGGFVQGRDYINPAIKPVFDRILEAVWQEVTKL